jgi:hypothetical protein
MLVSIQFICIAISLIFAATMSVGHFRDLAFLKYRDGIVRYAMFSFVIFTFVMSLLIAIIRPY